MAGFQSPTEFTFNRGLIEPGSSGSGLFTIANGRLELRGVLSQGADSLSCTQPTLFTLYTRRGSAIISLVARYGI